MITFASYILKYNSQFGFYLLFLFILISVGVMIGKSIWAGLFLLTFVIVNYIFSGDMNHQFLKKYGESGVGVVTAIENSEVWINDVRQLNLTALLKSKNNKTIKTEFSTHQDIYDTSLDMETLPGPAIGEEFAIQYLPSHMNNFAILPDVKTLAYGKRIACLQISRRIQKTEAVYKFTPWDGSAIGDYKAALQAFIGERCNAGMALIYLNTLQQLGK